jgi:integrase
VKLKTRIRDKDHWFTIGTHGAPWTPETPAFAAVADEFLQHHGKKIEWCAFSDYERLLRRYAIPAFGKRPIDTIDRAAIAKLHHSLADIPRQANLLLSVLSKLMGWASKRGLHPSDTNPCRGIERYKENKRERFLTVVELRRLGQALREAEQNKTVTPYAIGAIRLLLLTGARLGEILTLQWEHVNFETRQLRLPRSKTGPKSIYLTTAVADILNSLPLVQGNAFVIAGDKPRAHLVHLQKPWSRIRDSAGLDDVRLHDLRHSYASVGAASGLSLLFVGKLLGHKQASTTQRYAHLAEDPVRQAGEQISDVIAKALGGSRV